MSRFFVPRASVKGNTISVSGDEAHHIIDVMRLKVSDSVVTFDGTGKEYAGVIAKADKRSLVIEVKIVRESQQKSGPSVTVIQAIPKREKIEYFIEKATELGVSSVAPVLTARTIPDWSDEKKASHVERWRKLAREASKQCGRLDIPEISKITGFRDLLANMPKEGLKLIAALDDRAIPLKTALLNFNSGPVMIAIGPEGDFTPEEVKAAVDSGFRIVSLGPRVLKSDTAGLFVLSVIGNEYAD
jgi:16S rRNA (uracil1498-N3)-methyltransferase